MKRAVGFHVTGRVQGVSFRAFTWRSAATAGVCGWVRNLPDGSVDGHLEGDPEDVAAVLDALRRGPPAARVAELRTWDAEFAQATQFEILR